MTEDNPRQMAADHTKENVERIDTLLNTLMGMYADLVPVFGQLIDHYSQVVETLKESEEFFLHQNMANANRPKKKVMAGFDSIRHSGVIATPPGGTISNKEIPDYEPSLVTRWRGKRLDRLTPEEFVNAICYLAKEKRYPNGDALAKRITTQMGYEKLTDIPQNRYEEFLEKLTYELSFS